MNTNAIGLDIGGANLKLAYTNGKAESRRFALWKEPQKLASELIDLAGTIPADHQIGVTMTGELCDCFRTKREGVLHIVSAVMEALPGRTPLFWSTAGKFVTAEGAIQQPITVAAANWHAQATFLGRLSQKETSLMIDMGSTTTDFIKIVHGEVAADGFTDFDRLATGELHYMGMRRTPVCAIRRSSCAEFFATSQDAFVLLGLLPEEPENRETADGRPMTREFAWERIARTIGGDRDTLRDDHVQTEAEAIVETLALRLNRAVQTFEVDLGDRFHAAILSGTGEKWVSEILKSERPGLQQISFAQKFSAGASEAACAFAVAHLRSEWKDERKPDRRR